MCARSSFSSVSLKAYTSCVREGGLILRVGLVVRILAWLLALLIYIKLVGFTAVGELLNATKLLSIVWLLGCVYLYDTDHDYMAVLEKIVDLAALFHG